MARQIVAERQLKVDGHDVVCRFFLPEKEEDETYFGYYEIAWPEQHQTKRAGGVDAVQALLLAMQRAHTDLLAARNMDGRKVEWLDQQSLGLPIAESIRDWDPDNGL